jgi:hypothetical protein
VTKRSPFAEALRAALDQSGTFSRQEWAEVLQVSKPAISQWVNDHTLPEPENLRSIVEVVKSADGTPPEVVERLEAALQAPAAQVSPHGLRAGRSFADYAARPLFSAFTRMWNGLTPAVKEAVLAQAVELCGRAFPLQEDTGSAPLSAFLDALGRLSPERREAVLEQAAALCARAEQAPWEEAAPGALRLVAAQADDGAVAEAARTAPARSYSVSVRNGVRLADALRAGPMHLAAVRDGVQAPRYDFYTLRRGRDDDPRRRFAMLQLTRKLEFGSIRANELLLYVVRGSVRLRAAPASRWTELASGGDGQVFWIRSPGESPGLPPLQVEPTSVQPPLLLAVFYARNGVEVESDASGQWFRPAETPWTPVAGHDAPVVVGAIPDGEAALEAFVAGNPIRDAHSVHRGARGAGQLSDADPPWWETGGSALNVRVLRFHRPAQGQTEDAVWLDSHGGEEIIIPLRGRFLCVYVDLHEGETDFRDDTCARFPDARRRHLGAESASEWSPSFPQPLPDLMLLDSHCAHGFFAVGDEDCYALHVRFLPSLAALGAGGEPIPEEAPRPYEAPRVVNQ